MARITVEDGLKRGYNKFMLVHLAAKRLIQLRKGKELLVDCDNKEIVASLREIEKGMVRLKPERSASEAFLEMEPELPAPTGDQIESDQADEDKEAEASAQVGEQGEPETVEGAAGETGSESHQSVEINGEPGAPENDEQGEGDEEENPSDTV